MIEGERARTSEQGEALDVGIEAVQGYFEFNLRMIRWAKINGKEGG